MQAMAWWLIPITATLLAVVWVTWINRPRKPADAHETLAAHKRFTAALERSEVGGGTHQSGQLAGPTPSEPEDAAAPAADR